jgi:SNF2 family DNA or RNA helicase
MTQEGHKILVFTSFRTALELVRKELNKNKITSYIIDGSVSSKKRMELVDKFNNDDTNVFLIMLKAGGTGLNLTSADIVIHLDLWWNPQAENQATDRAHRIGQKNKVQVIKLITKGTIEEKILELQQKKKILSEKLIDENDVNQALDKLTEKDIIELLSFDNDEDY